MFRSVQFQADKGLGRVALAAFGLGVFMALHVAALAYTLCVALPNADGSRSPDALDRWRGGVLWSLYALALGLFHLSEFLLTAEFRPAAASYESFLLNHSREYHIALLVSCIEFWLELLFVPSWKLLPWVLPLGLAVVGIGQYFRAAAMWTAAGNFSHRIEYMKRREHVLVTHGVYRFVRHPSYLGWFLWTVGTQVLLGNPLSSVAYAVVAWGFFRDRIPYVDARTVLIGFVNLTAACVGGRSYEEQLLLGFFPDEYPAYRARTISGVPFVSGAP